MKKRLILALALTLAACGGETKTPDYVPVYPLDSSLNLSDNVLDGQLAMEGVVYQMPIPVSELTANGWTHDAGNYSVEPQNSVSFTMQKDGLEIFVTVINEFSAYKDVNECHVVKLVVGPRTGDTKAFFENGGKLINAQFTSAVNISTGEADLRAALGEPDSDGDQLIWRGDNGKYFNLGVRFSAAYTKDGTLNCFTLEYLPDTFQP